MKHEGAEIWIHESLNLMTTGTESNQGILS